MVLAALALLAVLAAVWEAAARGGAVPLKSEEPGSRRWVRQWEAARAAVPPRILVLGSSRTLNAVNPPWLARAAGGGYSAHNLGIPVGNSLKMLETLEADLSAGDVVVLDVLPSVYFGGRKLEQQQEAENRLARARPYQWLEDELARGLKKNLAIARAGEGPLEAVHGLARRALGRPIEDPGQDPTQRVVAHDNGFREWTLLRGDRAYWNARAIEQSALTPPLVLPPDARAARVAVAESVALCRRLEARGVTVLWLRLPVGGLYAEKEERLYPRRQTWDVLAAALPGRCVHFADEPELADLWTPDGSHLEVGGARVFCDWLGRHIRRVRLAPPPPLAP
ncbi:MAG: hypothetical protein HS108_08350 [Planctomycetes bacterium]|nr:hypothetical protein [Planctomycetota bacterium]MCL4730810.1 hypothetical protein [Planctomycetota bacterium]